MQREVEDSRARIAEHVRLTPCDTSRFLSDAGGADVTVKLECLQVSGSFKFRGVINKVLSLDEEERSRLLVAASTGNHGAAFAHAVKEFDLDGKMFMPKTAAPVKMEKLRRTGIAMELVGEDCVEAENHAATFARDHGHTWISPYNDPVIVHGQGTIAVEILEQLGRVDVVLVPVGGGGLISGVAGYLKEKDPEVTVIGCQPRNSCVMQQSIAQGRIVEAPSLPTISDGTAGGIEMGSITFDLCRRYVDDFILLEEEEISSAMGRFFHHEEIALEGAAALPVAALLGSGKRFSGQRVVLIASGGNVDEESVRRLADRRSRND